MTELEYRLHWARSYLKRCGLVINQQRGIWALTSLGKSTTIVEPTDIVRIVQEQLRQERKSQSPNENGASQPPLIVEVQTDEVEVTVEKEVENAAVADIKSPTPDFPLYSQAKHFLRIIDGTAYSLYRSMYNEIWGQRGNPQEQVDWADPDLWIAERLDGIELGISSVREVIQVKRHRGNINRTVLDQLRGSLHRFDAVRGTVITTGRFSKGVQQAAFERGAAPITLIDGEKLLDLLMEYQIGVTKKPIEYYEFDPAKISQFQ
ncbi:MAG: restriction endonuclease [Caldilineaceae bacterium]|nr:restriction endonuclease [Caldilineaceae bacterium]